MQRRRSPSLDPPRKKARIHANPHHAVVHGAGAADDDQLAQVGDADINHQGEGVNDPGVVQHGDADADAEIDAGAHDHGAEGVFHALDQHHVNEGADEGVVQDHADAEADADAEALHAFEQHHVDGGVGPGHGNAIGGGGDPNVHALDQHQVHPEALDETLYQFVIEIEDINKIGDDDVGNNPGNGAAGNGLGLDGGENNILPPDGGHNNNLAQGNGDGEGDAEAEPGNVRNALLLLVLITVIYICLGAFVYTMFDPSMFTGEDKKGFLAGAYFSIVGYGDITPNSFGSHLMVWLYLLVGLSILTVTVSELFKKVLDGRLWNNETGFRGAMRNNILPQDGVLNNNLAQGNRDGEGDAGAEPGNMRNALLLFVLITVIYICLGAFVYTMFDPSMFTGEDKKGFLAGAYFSTVTVTTVGYGDIKPNSFGSQLMACLYLLVGFAILTVFVSELFKKVLDGTENKMCSRWNNETGFRGAMRKVLPSFVFLVAVIAVNVFIAKYVEERTWWEAIYFSIISATSAGFGDIAFVKSGGRRFALAWLLVSTLSVARFYTLLAELWADFKAQSIIRKAFTIQDLAHGCIHENGSVREADFIIYKLVKSGKANRADIIQIRNEFRRIDVDNTGRIVRPQA